MMAAQEAAPDALVLIEPSAPAEVQGTRTVPEASGVFDSEAVYGRFPEGIPSRPESTRARAERKRGIPVPALPAPTLVVFGDEFERERGRDIARLYGCDEAHYPGIDHWGLVLRPEVRHEIARYIARVV